MADKYSYRITPLAEDDIDGVLAYIANSLCNTKAAKDLLDKVSQAIANCESGQDTERFALVRLKGIIQERSEYLPTIKYIAWVIQQKIQFSKQLSDKRSDVREAQEAIQQEIKRKQGYALALYEDYKSGLLTKEECVMAREQYQKEIEALKAQVERLECPEDGAAQAIEKSKEWEKRFEEYRHAEVISQELISAFVDRIQVWADGSIKITFLFDNELKGLQAQYKSLREEVA